MENNEKANVTTVTEQEKEEFFSGGSNEIKEILDLIEKRDKLINEIKLTSNEGKKLEKELADKKKSIEKEEKEVVNKALSSELEQENRIIETTNSKIKTIKGKRDRAKEKGIKRRIKEETADLIETNTKVKCYIRKTLKENNLPGYCDNDWYYLMYCNQGIVQLLMKWMVFIIGYVVIPYIVVKIVNPWFLLKGILWFVIAALFFGIYITIYLLTKDNDTGTLEELREYREKIAKNNRRIREIKRNIRKDDEDETYGLDKYDEDLKMLEETLNEATDKKNTKTKLFEENVKKQIIESVREKHSESISKIEEEIIGKVNICKEKTEELKSIEEKLENDYEKFLTKPYLNVGCINRMHELVESGNAKNIGEAFEIVK